MHIAGLACGVGLSALLHIQISPWLRRGQRRMRRRSRRARTVPARRCGLLAPSPAEHRLCGGAPPACSIAQLLRERHTQTYGGALRLEATFRPLAEWKWLGPRSRLCTRCGESPPVIAISVHASLGKCAGGQLTSRGAFGVVRVPSRLAPSTCSCATFGWAQGGEAQVDRCLD